MFIFVVGTPMGGFQFHGLFDTEAKAEEYGEAIYPNVEWWVAPMTVLNAISVDSDGTNIYLREDNTIESECVCGHRWSQHVQNVHGLYVCSQCNCRNMRPPSEIPK